TFILSVFNESSSGRRKLSISEKISGFLRFAFFLNSLTSSKEVIRSLSYQGLRTISVTLIFNSISFNFLFKFSIRSFHLSINLFFFFILFFFYLFFVFSNFFFSFFF